MGSALDRPPLASFGRRGEELRKAFEAGGVQFTAGSRSELDVGESRAALQFEPDQWLRFVLPLPDAPEPLAALQAGHRLPGNVRFVGAAGAAANLVADSQLDGLMHLPATIAEIRRGFLAAVRGEPLVAAEIEAPADVAAAVARLDFGEDGIVDRGAGAWELRPRIDGRPVPVILDAANAATGGARVSRKLHVTAGDETVAAAADQALRFNGQFRFCRVAVSDEGDWRVESRLHAGLVEPRWLATAALAVAVAATRAEVVLGQLTESVELARWYRALCGVSAPGSGSRVVK